MEQLNTYIQQARQQGQTDDQIRQALVAGGWNPDQVNGALGGTASPLPPPPPPVPSLNQPATIVQPTVQPTSFSPQVSAQALPGQAPVVVSDQAAFASPQPSMPGKLKSKLPLVVVGLIALIVIVAGGVYALSSHKAGYQAVIQEFITAIQKKDKKTADSLESPAAKAYFQKSAGSSSFYDSCQQAGPLCTASFGASYLAKATKSYKDYTAANGTKGKEEVFTVSQSQGAGQACTGKSSSTITIAVVPSGGSWLIDNVTEDASASGVTCPASGSSSSPSDTFSSSGSSSDTFSSSGSSSGGSFSFSSSN